MNLHKAQLNLKIYYKKKKKLSKVIKVLKNNKFKYVELDTLVPVDFINQKSSDNFRHLMFTFTNQNTSWALRPDLTLMSLTTLPLGLFKFFIED